MKCTVNFLVEKEFPNPAFLCIVNLMHYADDRIACYVEGHSYNAF